MRASIASAAITAAWFAAGTNAALAAAAKYFRCQPREVMLLVVQEGSTNGQRAIFDARCTSKLETPITITPAAKPLRMRSVKGGRK